METKINKLRAELELSISLLEQECKVCGNVGYKRRIAIINERADLIYKLKLIV